MYCNTFVYTPLGIGDWRSGMGKEARLLWRAREEGGSIRNNIVMQCRDVRFFGLRKRDFGVWGFWMDEGVIKREDGGLVGWGGFLNSAKKVYDIGNSAKEIIFVAFAASL